MQQFKTMLLLAAIVAGGCDGSGASDNLEAEFVRGCMASSNLDRAFCECAAAKAREDLSADAFAFLVATLNDDEEGVRTLRGKLAPSEALEAGMFMVNAHKHCAPAGQSG